MSRFLQGKSVPENVYDMEIQLHKPIMIAVTPEVAEYYVALLNAGTCSRDEDIRDRDVLTAAAVEALEFICSGSNQGRDRVVEILNAALALEGKTP